VIAKLAGERNDERFQAVLDDPDLADPEQPEDFVHPDIEVPEVRRPEPLPA